ncbi:MAG: hypothetical protein ACI9WU_001493 [Myxococcota bacterium]|jgi:hypothetical protein
MTIRRSLLTLSGLLLVLAACAKPAEKDAAPKAPAKPAPEVEADPPAHPNGPGLDHARAIAPPPPTATRGTPAIEIDKEQATIVVSDLVLAPGVAGVVPIEVRPRSPWKINTEYPSRVTLEGLVSAVPPRMTFLSGDTEPPVFQVTSGGLRIDLPFTGDAPGDDRVRARVRYGVCSADACQIHKHEVAFTVTVAHP